MSGPRLSGARVLRERDKRMSDACCAHDEPQEQHTETGANTPWWRDRGVMIPVASGVAFVAGLVSQWAGGAVPALVLLWAGLRLGAWTFVPGAVRNVAEGQLGVALLMTLTAT